MKQLNLDMETYLEIDNKIKELTEQKNEIRKKIIPQLDEEEYEGLKLTKKRVITWDDENFLAWVKKDFPEFIDKVTRQLIDYEKFETYVASGEINYDELPEYVYKVRIDNVITRSKKNDA